MSTWFQSTFAALVIRDFRILWTVTGCSALAFFMSTIVQSVVAFDLVGSNTAVGVVVFAQGVAMSLLGPLGGALADRWPKRHVLLASHTAPALVFLGLALAHATGTLGMGLVAGGSFMMGISFAFLAPARQAYILELVPSERRGNAVALIQVAVTASQVMGPGLAGLLLLWKAAGPAGAYAVMGLLYVLALLLLIPLPHTGMRPGAGDTRVLTDVAAGLRYVARHPRLRLLLPLYVGVIMTAFPYVTVMPALVEHSLGRSAETYAFLSLVAALGGLAASLAVARYADHPRATLLFCSMGAVFGLGLIALASVPSYAAAVVVMLLLGVGSGGFMTLNAAVIVNATEPAYFGRVMSLTMLAFGLFGLMGLPIGALADRIGERSTLVGMGAFACALVGLFALLLARVNVAADPV